MSTDRSAAAALVLGSLAGLVTMGLHPTGNDVVRNATAGDSNFLANAVHLLALVAEPLLIAGMLALTLQLRERRELAMTALVFYVLAGFAVIVAAAASGFLAPATVSGMAGADEPTRALMRNSLYYTGLINQVFARIFVLFSSIAIIAWSVAMLAGSRFPRGLAMYGAVIGSVLLLAIASGRFRLDIHGFGLVVLAEGVWMIGVAVNLWNRPYAA
jgi:hypothetical protein